MGVDIYVLAEHSLSEESWKRFPTVLQDSADLLMDLVSKNESELNKWWTLKRYCNQEDLSTWIHKTDFYLPNENDDLVEIEGPHNFFIQFAKHACVIHPPMRWQALLDDRTVQLVVTEVCNSIGKALGCSKLIYLPDSSYKCANGRDLVDEGKKLIDIEEYLLKDCGPPAKNLSDITRKLSDEEMLEFDPKWNSKKHSRFIESDGYYIEDLKTK